MMKYFWGAKLRSYRSTINSLSLELEGVRAAYASVMEEIEDARRTIREDAVAFFAKEQEFKERLSTAQSLGRQQLADLQFKNEVIAGLIEQLNVASATVRDLAQFKGELQDQLVTEQAMVSGLREEIVRLSNLPSAGPEVVKRSRPSRAKKGAA